MAVICFDLPSVDCVHDPPSTIPASDVTPNWKLDRMLRLEGRVKTQPL